MHLNELKSKNPSDLLSYAESLDIDNASNLRKQAMMFACVKELAENDGAIYGGGVLECLLTDLVSYDLLIQIILQDQMIYMFRQVK